MTIWKYPLATTDEQFISVPAVNRPLAVQMQYGIPCLWILVDPIAEKRRVRIRIFGTGHPGIEPGMDYIGTYQDGSLVFHVFIAPLEER